MRIVRALKEGKDPNETNPKPEPAPPEESLPALDPDDPEVQQFGGPSKPQSASVEPVPDEQDQVEARLARQSSIDQSLHPSAQVSARGSPGPGSGAAFDPYPRDGFSYNAVLDDNVSPLEPSPNDRNSSVGGGYFPEVPTFTSESQEPTLPTAAPDDILDLGLPDQPSAPPGESAPEGFRSFPPPTVSDEASLPPPPQDFYHQAPLTSQPPAPQQPKFQTPPVQAHQSSYHPQQHYQPPPQHNVQPSLPIPVPLQARKEQLHPDDVAIAKAQKHARWAISALNFEDAETAIKELRAALQTLGAQ